MLFQILITFSVIFASSLEYNYFIKSFDMTNSRCDHLFNFSFDSILDQVYYNEENPNLLERVIAVKNKTQLVNIILEKSCHVAKENLIKEFEHDIVLVEPKWNFGRVYIMTFNGKKNLNRVYEIDLIFKTIIELVFFTSSNSVNVFIVPDPFHATLTYVINNYVYAVNTHYPSIAFDQLNLDKKQAVFTDLGKSESFFMDSAYCSDWKYGPFELVLSSSLIIGYQSIQTYFISSNSRYFKCLIYKNRCTCTSFKDLSVKNKFIQITDYYQSEHCAGKTDNNSFIIEYKKSHFGNDSKQFRECLRICSIPKWKKEINYEYVSSSMKCVNNLKASTSLEQFGIALIQTNNNVTKYKIRINYYKEFMEQLLGECSRYELMYKYSVYYSRLESFRHLNEVNINEKKRTIESSIQIDFDIGFYYIFNVLIQSPFDSQAYNLGTFVLSEKFEMKNEIDFSFPNYLKVIVDPIPVLFEKDWYQHVSANEVIICLLSQSFKLKSQIKYILTNVESGETNLKIINFNTDLYYLESKSSQVLFKIANLNENSIYQLRIMSEPMPNQIASLSNMITFNTLNRPNFEILFISSDNIYLSIFLNCKLLIEETNLNYYTKKIENACHLFRILIKPQESDIWQEKIQVLISDELVKNSKEPAVKFKILVKNLSSSTNYSLKIDLETYYMNSNSNRFESSLHILSSNTTSFQTRKSSKTYYSFLLIGIGCSICLFALALSFLTNYLKKTKKFITMNVKSKNLFDHERGKFLENMNPNLLYAFAIKKKEIKKEVLKLPQIDQKDLELIRPIGKGAFGQVYEGRLKMNEVKTSVAIKKLRENFYFDEKLDLIKEALALNSFNHPNLLKFYGICVNKNQFEEIEVKFIITELMNSGDLLSYLRLCRKTKQSLEYKKAIKVFLDISNACAYLESKGFIHRDLAARNCLVQIEEEDKTESLRVKLGDFGMAHELYSVSVKDYYKQINNLNKLLPIRWMSPESICDGVYSSKSDVWAFGVIVWEVLTLGFQPYFGMENLKVIEYIKSGGKLQVPQKCPSEMNNLMIECWNSCAEKRPTFKKISNDIEKIYSNFYYSNESKNVIPIFDETYLNDISNFKMCSMSSFIKRSNCSEFDEGFSDVFSETPESSLNKENKSLIN